MNFGQKRTTLLVIIALAGLASFVAPTASQQLSGVAVGLIALAVLTVLHIKNKGDRA
ncbi:hypothetical protein [Pontivivens insulae]|uniref:Uncharacterized protein n=1 Tax=Pontivivens insulae TaxID=1639689 RepID=A0A2R8ABX4_9RHOB|nr:hypothetical protein [Pontivivens insulae]RED11267.1 hypothetical protein DFR53_3301 [Pontivivens insulae]SPF29560.1 hypothetical protein POI8812_01872 [Pontivivens insulae]